jgi:phosphoribosylanthranilate isomerase
LRGEGVNSKPAETHLLIVQIYEIQTPAEAEAILSLGVDHVGSVVLSANEWKDPGIHAAIRLTQSSGNRSSLIPLFNTFENAELVLQVLNYYQPDIVHFCDSLSDGSRVLGSCRKMVDLQTKVKQAFPEIAVMRSIPIASPGFGRRVPTFELAALFETASDYFLTDTWVVAEDEPKKIASVEQPVAGFIGITGRTCDWDVARRLVAGSRIPVILAGGISPDNVEEGLTRVQPAGIDSCTGTNAVNDAGLPIRFKKDYNRVKRLVDTVRRF